jgi:Zn-dependent metalloprotease
MRRLRGNGGQTTVEWLVLMAAVVALAAVLVTSLPNVAGAITGRFGCIVSSVVDQGSCPAGPRSTDRPRPGGERRIYDGGDGHLIREEGDDPSGDPEADAVYDNFGRVYDYYMGKFGRNSYDDMGAPLIGTVNYPPACSGGAYWSPSQKQMYFCPGFAGPLDVTAHEVTHAVTERTAGLDYQGESGALNEAVSDMFASNVDGNWQIGEGLPDGAIRDMADPDRDGTNPDNCPDDGRFCQPANVRDFYVTDNDHGGVHTNSGIPNHAYYNMVQNIGRDASEQILYTAVTQHLNRDSGYEDFRTACLEAARERYGQDSDEYRGVDKAFRDVGLDGTWKAPR